MNRSMFVFRQKTAGAGPRRVGWLLQLIIALACTSCVVTSARMRKSTPLNKVSAASSVQTKSAPSRASQPHPTEKKVESEKLLRSDRKESSASEKQKKKKSASQKASSEDKLQEKLRRDSYELARDLGAVVAMKLCHDKKTGEWWLTLYRDTETAIDVRQFIWSLDKDEFTPFLVVKRIPKEKLTDHLKGKEQGRTCVELPAPLRDANDPFEKFWGRNPDFGK
jgi:hypothetical protein